MIAAIGIKFARRYTYGLFASRMRRVTGRPFSRGKAL